MRVTFFLLTLNLLLIFHVTSAFDTHRQKRSAAEYDHYFDKFVAKKYSDLTNGKGQSYSNYHSAESGSEEGEGTQGEYNEENSGSEESDGAHEEYNNEEDSGEASSYEENESHEDHSRRRRSPENYFDHYNRFVAEHFSDDDFLNPEKEELISESGESSGSAEEDDEEDDEERDQKAKVKDRNLSYHNNDYERIKELSEKQVEHLHKKPGNCKQFDKDGMICSVCKDPETGDTSESCAYASQPNDKKWAYLNRKSQNFKHPQVEASEDESEQSDDDDEAEEDEEKATSAQIQSPKAAKHKSELEEASDYGAYRIAGYNKDIDYDEPKFAHYNTFRGKNKPKSEKLIELLPSSKSQFNSKNLNQALTDFETKDWSKCKKVFKGELTCYYCKDASGASNEECMYVSASNPKHLKVERHDAGSFDENSRRPKKSPIKSTTHVKSLGYSLPLKVAPTTIPFKSAAPTRPTILSSTLGRNSLPLISLSTTQPAHFSTTIGHSIPLKSTFPTEEKFARLRMGRPLMPTKASKLETAEPLVTPKTSISSFFGDDLTNPSANLKKTIKRTIIKNKKRVTADDYVPAESRAMHFETHVNHEKQ